MTREVAIKAIQDFIGWFKEDSLIRKALDVAIQALSQEPCDDAISREAVCDYIAEFVNNEYSTQSECDMVELMIKGIKHLPPVSTTKNIVNHGTMNITL